MEDLSNILLRDYLTIQMTMLKAIRLHATLKKDKRSRPWQKPSFMNMSVLPTLGIAFRSARLKNLMLRKK
jgi:hypothetical protein